MTHRNRTRAEGRAPSSRRFLHLQTTGVYREDFLEGIAARHGAGRLLFASRFPAFDPRLELRRVQWAPSLDEPARGSAASTHLLPSCG